MFQDYRRSLIPQSVQDVLDRTLKYWRLDRYVIGTNKKEPNYRFRLWSPYNPEAVPETIVAGFSLSQMPGCCGLCVSHDAYVISSLRGRGIGTALNELRIYLARNMGYTCLLCTDVDSNEPQKKILSKNGWKTNMTFCNKRTGNIVNLHSALL